MESTPDGPLPRIAADGRMPMQVYAAGFDPSDQRPKVGLILAGIGLNGADSQDATNNLPGGITFALSPYAQISPDLLAKIRLAEHEYLLSLPMEPQSFPLNDPGDKALLTRNTPEENEQRMRWALSRFAGYVGVTGALGSMRGERFAKASYAFDPVLHELSARGLLYADPRPDAGKLPSVWQRRVDVIIDDRPDDASIDSKLGELDRLAAERGSALGLAGAVRPETIARIAAWANELPAKGLALAPVSALAVAPPATEPTQ